MPVDRAEPRPDVGRYVVAFAVQLALTAVAVALSVSGRGGRAGTAAVMLIAAANAVVVAFRLMDVRRNWFVSMLVLLTLVLIAGLLVWPAWDVYDRSRVF